MHRTVPCCRRWTASDVISPQQLTDVGNASVNPEATQQTAQGLNVYGINGDRQEERAL